jgi:galactokinase
VRIPSDAAVIVAHSGEIAQKAGPVRDEYNRRVIECSIAARVLGHALKIEGVPIIGDLFKVLPDRDVAELLSVLAAAAPARLNDGIREAARILSADEQLLRGELLGEFGTRIEIDERRPLEILSRARHVLTETARVRQAVIALEAGELAELGSLMDRSHRSLRDDFEVSTPALDMMVEIARRAGALGARLTGAGFGGCIVALCRAADSAAVIEAFKREYYQPRFRILGSYPPCALVRASAGASMLTL